MMPPAFHFVPSAGEPQLVSGDGHRLIISWSLRARGFEHVAGQLLRLFAGERLPAYDLHTQQIVGHCVLAHGEILDGTR